MNSIHQLDALRFAGGIEYQSVVAQTTRRPGTDVDERAAAVFRTTSGAIVVVQASADVAGVTEGESIEIDGTNGRLILDGAWDTVTAHIREDSAVLPRGVHRLRPESGELYTDTVADFVQSVANATQPSAGLLDARASLAAVLAAYRSAATGSSEPAI